MLCCNKKGTRKVKKVQKTFKYRSFTSNFSNLYFMTKLYGWKETIFLVLIFEKNLLIA